MQAGCSERIILHDFKACTEHVRKGVLVQPVIADISQWQVTFMPKTGLFKDLILTCFIQFDNYPAAVPKVIFQQGIIHPLVDPITNRFDASEMFTEWNVSIRAYTLINYVFDSFLDITIPSNPSTVPNPEAVQLLKKGNDVFMKAFLKNMPLPPDPSERNEINTPKRWGNQKERVAHILVALNSQ